MTATTPIAGDNSTKIATTAYVTNNFAPIASPTFTGIVTATTPIAGDNSTQIATTAYVTSNFAPIASPTFTGIVTANSYASAKGAKQYYQNDSNLYNVGDGIVGSWNSLSTLATTFNLLTSFPSVLIGTPATIGVHLQITSGTSTTAINGIYNLVRGGTANTWTKATISEVGTPLTTWSVAGTTITVTFSTTGHTGYAWARVIAHS